MNKVDQQEKEEDEEQNLDRKNVECDHQIIFLNKPSSEHENHEVKVDLD